MTSKMKSAVIQWNDTKKIVNVTIGVGTWDETFDDDGIFFWMEEEDIRVGYTEGEWTIVAVEKDAQSSWRYDKPTTQFAGQQVFICLDYCDVKSDFAVATVEFVQVYNGAIEPYYFLTKDEAMVYSIAAKELLSDSSFTRIAVPGGWGATIFWLPVSQIK